MMKPKDELCSIFWIVLVDLTGKFGHPSGNHHHVVDHIWNDDGQNCVDVGDVVGDVDHHNHGGFGEIVMMATSWQKPPFFHDIFFYNPKSNAS